MLGRTLFCGHGMMGVEESHGLEHFGVQRIFEFGKLSFWEIWIISRAGVTEEFKVIYPAGCHEIRTFQKYDC